MVMVQHSLVEAVGRTPVVGIRTTPVPAARIYAKLEWYNPTGSLKDRIVTFMVERAEERGELRPGMTIVEATSGNTGIALAAVAAHRGYPALIVMAENMSVERQRIIQALGAKVLLTPAAEGSDGAIRRARELAKAPEHYFLSQFENQDNVLAHYRTTAPEILTQVPDLDTFVAGMGTGGTVTGVARRLKETKPAVKVVAIEPRPGSHIQGLKCFRDYVPPIVDFSLIDEVVTIEDEDAFQAVRLLAEREGLFVGMSSGAVMHVMEKQVLAGRRVVVGIFGDCGAKYLSTELFP
jgi:cysteine synthase